MNIEEKIKIEQAQAQFQATPQFQPMHQFQVAPQFHPMQQFQMASQFQNSTLYNSYQQLQYLLQPPQPQLRAGVNYRGQGGGGFGRERGLVVCYNYGV